MNNLAKELNESLKDLPESKEYFNLKEQLEKDEYINSLLNVIKQTQKESQECLKNNDIANYKIKVATLETLKQEFINHPLINNYLVCKQQVEATLKQIVDIISE